VYIPRGFNSDIGDNNFRGAGEYGGIGGYTTGTGVIAIGVNSIGGGLLG
jgi:hypothetical protein